MGGFVFAEGEIVDENASEIQLEHILFPEDWAVKAIAKEVRSLIRHLFNVRQSAFSDHFCGKEK